jgi:acyl-CoA hydrolase
MAEATNKRAEPRTVSRSHSELIRWMSIQDANSAGFVHGGVVMRMCDEAAGIAAIRHSGCRVVTAGMDRMTFLQPVHVGELLRCTASVNAVWRTSMEVGVRVEAENAVTGEVKNTGTAYLTMVAVDEYGQPVRARDGRRLGGLTPPTCPRFRSYPSPAHGRNSSQEAGRPNARERRAHPDDRRAALLQRGRGAAARPR